MTIDINQYSKNTIILEGYEEAIVGIVNSYDLGGRRILYSKNQILKILEREGRTQSEAEEYFNTNIIGVNYGDESPIFQEVEILPKKKNNNDIVFELLHR